VVPAVRAVAAVLAATAVAFGCAVVLGEYSFTGPTPWVAALVVPALIVATGTGLDRSRPARWWPAGGALGAAGVALGVWFSIGRGLDPWPAAGTLSAGGAALWPLVVGRARRAHDDGGA
jgi:hypothetical protein